jgi:hypothetical protein
VRLPALKWLADASMLSFLIVLKPSWDKRRYADIASPSLATEVVFLIATSCQYTSMTDGTFIWIRKLAECI